MVNADADWATGATVRPSLPAMTEPSTAREEIEDGAATVMAYVEAGGAVFWRINGALFAAGFATFATLYSVQPLLPVFAAAFGLSPAVSSLALSVSTALLAVSMLVAGALSEAWGRKPVMLAALLLSGVLTIATALAPSFTVVLVLRGLGGAALGGLPAVAMAYLAEEMTPSAIGVAMGLYIAGNAVGGMSGRLITALVADAAGWRVAVGSIGGLGLVAALILWGGLPASQHFRPRPLRVSALAASFAGHLRAPVLPVLFAEGFLLMGGFVTVYNYIGFRLLAPPYSLSQSAVGLLFCVYLVGVVSSTAMGALAGRVGRRSVMVGNVALMLAGVGLTLARPVWIVVAGVGLVTWGFFGGHAVVSGWVSGAARQARAQASSLYLFAYYAGSSIVGTLGGWAWSALGWPGVAGLVALVLGGALALAAALPGR